MKIQLHVMAVLVVICLPCIRIEAQTQQQSAATVGAGTISGRVSNNDRPMAGVQMALMSAQLSGPVGRQALARAETDSDGRYLLTGVAAGSYIVVPLSPLYVIPGITPGSQFGLFSGKQVTLNDGESVTGIDLTLVRGGVITGKISDADGRPVIEQFVQLDRLDQNNNPMPYMALNVRRDLSTDDRGIYRVYGVPPGRYRVSSGDGEGTTIRISGRKSYPRTFHPDVTDAAEAKIIDISEGGEASGIDIRMAAPAKSYAVIGRAVDAETGDGVPNIPISFTALRSDGRPGASGFGSPSGQNGEFRIEGVRSGRYQISAGGNSMFVAAASGAVGSSSPSAGYSDPVNVEVVEGDVSGVELKVSRGGTVSGIAVIEGSNDPAVLARISQIFVVGFMRPPDGNPSMPVSMQSRIGPDRTFRFDGVRPGKLQFSASASRSSEGALTLLRVERDGVSMPDGIEVGPGEQIGGVRMVFVFGSGVVRGQVNVINGALPPGATLSVRARIADGARQLAGRSAMTDSRGQFVLDGLVPGQYEIETSIMFAGPPPPEFRRRIPPGKLPVVVANGQTQQVTLTLDLAPQEPRR